MECKGPQVYLSAGTAQVLIETSWNVKVYISDTTHETLPVLIETSWNVKLGSPQSPLNLQDCINRNIVECKV